MRLRLLHLRKRLGNPKSTSSADGDAFDMKICLQYEIRRRCALAAQVDIRLVTIIATACEWKQICQSEKRIHWISFPISPSFFHSTSDNFHNLHKTRSHIKKVEWWKVGWSFEAKNGRDTVTIFKQCNQRKEHKKGWELLNCCFEHSLGKFMEIWMVVRLTLKLALEFYSSGWVETLRVESGINFWEFWLLKRQRVESGVSWLGLNVECFLNDSEVYAAVGKVIWFPWSRDGF